MKKGIESRLVALEKVSRFIEEEQSQPIDPLSISLYEFEEWCAKYPDEWESLLTSLSSDDCEV